MQLTDAKNRVADDIRCMNPSYFDWLEVIETLMATADRFGLEELLEVLTCFRDISDKYADSLYIIDSTTVAMLDQLAELSCKNIIATKLANRVNGNVSQLKAEFNLLCVIQAEGALVRLRKKATVFKSRTYALTLTMTNSNRHFLEALYDCIMKFYSELLTTYILLTTRYS